MSPCLTLSIIRYGSRVKWSNPGKGIAPSPTPWCSSFRKGSLRVTLDYGSQLYFFFLLMMIYFCNANVFYSFVKLSYTSGIVTFSYWNHEKLASDICPLDEYKVVRHSYHFFFFFFSFSNCLHSRRQVPIDLINYAWITKTKNYHYYTLLTHYSVHISIFLL